MHGSMDAWRYAYRTGSPDDVKEFAKGCMSTYLILKDKAAQFKDMFHAL